MKQCLWCLFLVIWSSSGLFALEPPKGNIKIIVSNQDQALVEGATVLILNSPFAGFTNANGELTFDNIGVGRYLLSTSSIGYSNVVQEIEVAENKTTEIRIALTTTIQALDEVVVSAERTENTAQKVPVSFTSLNAKQIQANRIWRFDDLSAISPNFHLSPSGSGYYMMTVRGINSYNKIPAVVTYIDDVPVFNGYIMGYNMQDLERIEFLRGPQGTLFGRGASGGVLNIKTQRPVNKTGGFAEVSFGNNNQQRYNAGIRLPVVKDKLFFSASGLYNQINGFFTNEFDQKRVGDESAIGGNVKLSFTPSEQWMFNYDLRFESNDQIGSVTRAANKETAFSKPYLVNTDQAGGTYRDFLIHAFTANYYGKKVNLKSITSFQDIRIDFDNYDVDETPLDYQYYYTPTSQPSKYFSQEFKLSNASTSTNKFNWLLGLFYLNASDLDDIGYHYGAAAPPLDLGGGNTLPPPYDNVTYSKTRSNSYAVYGQLSYPVFSKTNVQLGLRFDSESSNLLTRTELEIPDQTPVVILPETEKSTSFTAFSPKVSLIQELNAFSSLFATYTRGYRPGGVNPYTSDPKYLSFEPEFSNNLELGYKLKSKDNRLRLSLAAFRIQVQDQQIYTITSGFNFATLNIGDITSEGLESELSFILFKGLQADWNLGLNKARFTKLPYFVFNQQGGTEDVDFSGNKPIQAPNLTSFFALNYTATLSKNSRLSLRGEWKLTGDQYFDYANTIEQPAYSLFNLRAAFAYQSTELSLWIRNVGDKKYLTYAYPFLLSGAQLSLPRTWGLTLNTRF